MYREVAVLKVLMGFAEIVRVNFGVFLIILQPFSDRNTRRNTRKLREKNKGKEVNFEDRQRKSKKGA